MAEARGGRPATVRSTHTKNNAGIIRIEFPKAPNAKDEALEEISWEEFFREIRRFETGASLSGRNRWRRTQQFQQIIGRETAEARGHGETHASRHHDRR
jgi:hypothetical protein